jgi:hypothetical protein
MKAGKTEFEVGTTVCITHIAGADSSDAELVGMIGELTHPFPGLMSGPASQYIAGVYVDPASATGKLVPGPLGTYTINLRKADRFHECHVQHSER